jgi:23S rRNA 5-hydroxycytidine C2501 synthase
VTIPLELLAPAGNTEIGIAAIDHGADAVYIGAPKFSARANAGVDPAAIQQLIRHAHLFYAKVYVALNTILTDEEIPEALNIIQEIYEFGADGLIIQDRGLLELDLPPIPLIASTQMHNDTPEKVRFLEDVGFKRAILARELSLDEIAAIRKKTTIELEVFVHGALCVSYSGQCYMSQAVAGRSGNRGVCAQPCRSRYNLIDGDGKRILDDKFLLSLKDLNLLEDIPSLIAAGVTSFKIEGRYKEIDYVKNVTATYRRALDDFIAHHPDYCRSSSGSSDVFFSPDPAKSFNRGFTRYFISGNKEKAGSIDTQKSIGQFIGTVTGIGTGFFKTDCPELQNGDGLCFFTKKRELTGFRIERVQGNRLYPNSMKDIAQGILLYRNYDIAMNRLLKKASARRQISVEMEFVQSGDSVQLTVRDEDSNYVEQVFDAPYVPPKDLAKTKEQIEKQISSAGNTPFIVSQATLSGRIGFLPVSLLNTMKRTVLAELKLIRQENHRKTSIIKINDIFYPEKKLDYHANIINRYAERFYRRHGVEVVEQAFETLSDPIGKEVMRTRYCLRYQLDACLLSPQSDSRLKEPLYLSDQHHIYRLQFDCKQCRMSVILERAIRNER